MHIAKLIFYTKNLPSVVDSSFQSFYQYKMRSDLAIRFDSYCSAQFHIQCRL